MRTGYDQQTGMRRMESESIVYQEQQDDEDDDDDVRRREGISIILILPYIPGTRGSIGSPGGRSTMSQSQVMRSHPPNIPQVDSGFTSL